MYLLLKKKVIHLLVKLHKSEDGIAPEAKHFERSHVIVATAKSTGNVDSTMDTLFGF